MLRPEGLGKAKYPPAVYGALLKDRYVMDTFHFHWGLRDYRGSEHRINGIRQVDNTNKSKGLPQQIEVAQGVPGRLRPRIFSTFRHYNGGRSAKRTGHLYPRTNPWYSLSEAESTSRHVVLSGEPQKKSPVTPPGIDPGTVRLVAKCLNHYATPGPR